MTYSVTSPEGEIREIVLPAYSLNQRLPSAPSAIPHGFPPDVIPFEY